MMQSAIIFLGTGSGATVRSKQMRSTAGMAFLIEGNQFVVDPGPGTLTKMKEYGLSPRLTTALLVSHGHLGHANDVSAMLDAMTYQGIDRQGILVANKTLLQGANDIYPLMIPKYKDLVERTIVLEPLKRLGINHIEIQALPCVHDDPHALGFKFMSASFTLVYSGDTAYHADVIEHYHGSDILILNVVSTEKVQGNLCVADAVKIISQVKPTLAVITHFNNKMIKADPIYMAREIQRETGVQTIAAKDGMVINPINYAAKAKQRMLQNY